MTRAVIKLALCLLFVLAATACEDRRVFFDRQDQAASPAEQQSETRPPETTLPPGYSAPSSSDVPEKRRTIGGIYPGTDTFVRRGNAPAGAVRTPQGEVTLNFVDADIREVVKAVLGDTLGANYVMDPQVQGTVTLQTADPVPGPALVNILESILAVNNAVLIQQNGIYKVVPADQAVRGSGVLRTTPSQAPGAQVLVVPLRYTSASEVEKILAPFAPPGGILRVDPRRNLMVIGGSRADVNAMVDVIETFDVDWLAGMSFGLFPVRSTSAKTIVDELEKVFGDQNDGPLANVVKFVPIERLNAVLVISPRSPYIERAKSWIDRLDVGEDETPRLYVYYCENSRAEDLAGVLSQVFGQQPQGGEGRPQAQLAPGLQAATLEGRQPGVPFDVAGGPSLGTARAQQQAQGAAPNVPPQGGPRPGGDGGVQFGAGSASVRIIADKVKNALVILAKPADYRTVASAVSKLDVLPLQVLLEATILEVTLNDALRYGVEWFFHFGGNRVQFSNATGTPVQPTPSLVTSTFPGFSYLLSPTQNDVKVIVNALDQVSDVNVISSPQVYVLDNQTATLTVGNQVPIVTRAAQSVISPDAPTVNSIEYRDTGVILTVTPRVNAGGLVTMEIAQEVSNVAANSGTGTTAQTQSPTISQRKVETTVAVQDGQTVALGGLITDSRTNSSSGLPWLSRLPFVGWLFGVKNEQAARTELLVLITPRVVGGAEQARQVTQELRARLRTVAPLEERLH